MFGSIAFRRTQALLGASALVIGIMFAQGASPVRAVVVPFGFTGGPQLFVVPAGDCSATVQALGASGGANGGLGGGGQNPFPGTPRGSPPAKHRGACTWLPLFPA